MATLTEEKLKLSNQHPNDLLKNKLINERYELTDFVGQGSMGAVYRAKDKELSRTVAIKCLIRNIGSKEDARREARTLATLNNQNVIQVYDVFEFRGQMCLVTEWVEGKTLEQIPRPVPTIGLMAIAAQLLDGLASAHSHGIFHRDIKPANIMLNPKGRIVLLDFGVAFQPGSSSGETMAGSLRYVAPSILEGLPPDANADLFSVGLVLLELLTGKATLPDLAPLPLYRFMKDKLQKIVDSNTNGLFPPLASLITKMILPETPADDKTATKMAIEFNKLYNHCTDEKASIYITEALGSSSWSEPDQEKLSAKAAHALARTDISPKEKARWYSYHSKLKKPVRGFKSRAKFPNFKKIVIAPKHRPIAALIGVLLLVGVTIQMTIYMTTDDRQVDLNTFARQVLGENESEAVDEVTAAVKEAVKQAVKEVVTEADPPANDHLETIDTTTAKTKGATSSQVSNSKASGKTDSSAISDSKKADRLKSALNKISINVSAAKPKTVAKKVAVKLAANAWAEVTVDGISHGRIPSAKPFELSVGSHRVRLESPFIETLEAEIQIEDTDAQRFRFKLKPRTTIKMIKLAQPADVYIDGKSQGYVKEKAIELSYGIHEITIKRNDTFIKSSKVNIDAETPEVLIFE